MNATPIPSLTPRQVLRILGEQRLLWLAPAVVGTVLAAAYACVAPRYWEASQALVVRQETAGASTPRPGKFADLYEMKTLQETILELARSRQVVVATLKNADRELWGGEPAEPTDDAVDKFRARMQMLPPGGAEFGKTEVFYFLVKDKRRERAIKLVGELCDQLDAGLRLLRAQRAAGLIRELEEEVSLAAKANARETGRLKRFESQVGADLGELRMMQAGSSGQSDLRQEAVQVGAEARGYQTEVRLAQQLLALLKSADKDPQQLLATPNSLLDSQPALRRLKEGLVDAQLDTARLGGIRSSAHPRMRAAIDAESQIRQDFHHELVAAIRGAEVDLELGRQRFAAADARVKSIDERLDKLAQQRAEYANRLAAVENSRNSLDRARQSLSTARAAQAAAYSGSLVTRLDAPETGPHPAGLRRSMIVAAGGVGGLMLGLGVVFLTIGPTPPLGSSASWLLAVNNAAQGAREPNQRASAQTVSKVHVDVAPLAPHADAPWDVNETPGGQNLFDQLAPLPCGDERQRAAPVEPARVASPPLHSTVRRDDDPRDEWWDALPVQPTPGEDDFALAAANPAPDFGALPTAAATTPVKTAIEASTAPWTAEDNSPPAAEEVPQWAALGVASAPAADQGAVQAAVQPTIPLAAPAGDDPGAADELPWDAAAATAVEPIRLPSAGGVLPRTAGTLPSLATAGPYGGMSLEDAVAVAAQQINR